MCPAPLPLGALRTRRLIGRTREKEAIKAAIEAEGKLRILHIIGDGGMGKTRLLETIREEILPNCSNKDRCEWGGIFDFYFADIQRSSGLEAAILAALDPKEQGFEAYRERRKELDRLREAGVAPQRIEEVRASLGDYFAQGFNDLSANRRIILCLDTVETIQYESDEVQNLLQDLVGTKLTAMEVKDWLITNIPKLKNAVIIFAGRPSPKLEEDFQSHFGDVLQSIRLVGLEESEVPEYLKAIGEVVPEVYEGLQKESGLPEWYKVVHLCTGGEPLSLALTVEVLRNNLPLPSLFGRSWREVCAKTPEEVVAIREEVEKALLETFFTEKGSDDIAVTLPFLAITPKGIDAELLEMLVARGHEVDPEWVREMWSRERCVAVLKKLRGENEHPGLSFVKPRPQFTFLHDKMYELMDHYLATLLPVFNQNLLSFQQVILEYYDSKLQEAKGRQRQDLLVDRLFYQLLANPSKGYAEYSRLSDEAIMSHETSFDMRLRDEMLRFFRPDEPDNPNLQRAQRRDPGMTANRINRGLAIRWVRRLVAAGEYELAENAARRVQESELATPEKIADDPYFSPILLTYQGEAMAYRGQDFSGAMAVLREAINRFDLAQPEPGSYLGWMKDLHLGHAYCDLGYVYARLKMYESAAREYSEALPRLRRTKLLGQQASTLTNLAYAYSLLGKLDEATTLCRDALDLWRREGYRYGEGLSLNTLGLIFTERGIYDAAGAYCRDALRIFEELEDQRGIGLACNALGRISRREGMRDIYTIQKAEEFFREAEEVLSRSVGVFTGPVPERARVVESYNERGCTYRDWAKLLRSVEGDSSRIAELEDRALEQLQESIDLALPDLVAEAADSFNDMADLYLTRGDPDKAWELLEESDGLILREHKEYEIVEGQGIPEIPEPISALWEVRGKNALLRGHIAFARGEATEQYEEAIQHYLLASAYLRAYSITATALGVIFKRMYSRLKGLSAEQLAELKRHAEELERRYCLPRTRLVDLFDTAIGSVEQVYQK